MLDRGIGFLMNMPIWEILGNPILFFLPEIALTSDGNIPNSMLQVFRLEVKLNYFGCLRRYKAH